MASYAEIRASRGDQDAKLKEQIDGLKKGGGGGQLDDETFLNISHVRGPEGTGWLMGRFLPACEGEDNDFVRYFEYAFEGPGGWYIQKSRATLGKNEKDPVYEYNGKLFKDKSLSDEDRKKKLLGRREYFVTNFLVLKDPNKPENEGQVFKYKFGPQVFGIIENALFPKASGAVGPEEEEVQRKIAVFDPFEGANFILRVTTKLIGKTEVPSYETSSFAKTNSSIVSDPVDFDQIWARQYPLEPLVAPEAFKSYQELVVEFRRAMDMDSDNIMDSPSEKPKESKSAQSNSAKSSAAEPEQPVDEIPEFEPKAGSNVIEDDDDWFNKLKTKG